MKRVSIYFLAFLTFWLSTWMVTDIHDWTTDRSQTHPLFSVASEPVDHALSNPHTPEHHADCSGVCSYDHGGHTGHSFPPVFFSPYFDRVSRSLHITQHYSFYNLPNPPALRPPIA